MFLAHIFIPTANSLISLSNCLQSLNNQTNKNFTIILVGKSKNNKIKTIIKQYPKLKISYFAQKKTGLVAAANEALSKTNSKIFIRIDDDIIADSHWFQNIILTFKASGKIGAVTGPTLLEKKRIKFRDSFLYLNKFKKSKNIFYKALFKIYNDYLYEKQMFDVGKFFKSGTFSIGSNYKSCLKLKKHSVDNLEACNFACYTNLLKKIGRFDNTFGKGLGDYHEADIAFKIKKAGYKIIFNPKVKVWHNIENTSVKFRPDPFNRLNNFIIFYKRHIGFKNFDYFFRFFVNLICQACYHLYKFFY